MGQRLPVSGALDRVSDRALYKQLADILRELIISGVFGPGAPLPSEKEVARQFRIGREAVRQAVGMLRGEGLVDTSRGKGSWVRIAVRRVPTRLGCGDRATVRAPSEPERFRHNIADGVAVVAVHRTDGTTEIYAADRIELVGGIGVEHAGVAIGRRDGSS